MNEINTTTQRKRLNFEKNFNKKLQCDYFYEIRLESPEFKMGAEFEIWCNGQFLGFCRCVLYSSGHRLRELGESIFLLDTGMTKGETLNLFASFYPGKDLNAPTFALMTMQRFNPGYKTPSLFND